MCTNIKKLKIILIFFEASLFFQKTFPCINMGKSFYTNIGMHLKSILLSMERNSM
jgi:ABC-type enterochelin transport system permease subunit